MTRGCVSSVGLTNVKSLSKSVLSTFIYPTRITDAT